MKIKTILPFLLFTCIAQPCLSQSNEIKNSMKHSSDGAGCISAPSHLLNGLEPEANWIWDSGEIKPGNYYLHVRKSFSLNNSIQDVKALG